MMQRWTKYLKNVKIRTQLMASFLFVAVITLSVLAFALYDMNNTMVATDDIYNTVLLPLNYVMHSTRLVENAKVTCRSSLLAKDPRTRDEMIQRVIADIVETKEFMEKFGPTIRKETAWAPYNTLLASLAEYLERAAPFRLIVGEDLTHGPNLDRAVHFVENTLSPLSDTCLKCLEELTTLRFELGEELMAATAGNTKTAFLLMITFSAFGTVLILLWGVYFSIHLSRPILNGVEMMTRAAEGDFSVTLPRDYGAEVGQLYNAFNSLLEYNRMTLSAISENSTTVRESAQNMLSISSRMAGNSRGLNEQTSFVSAAAEEFSAGMTQSSNALSTASVHISAVASSIEEINATIATVAAAAEETSTRVEQSSSLVDNIKNSISTASGSVTLVSEAFNTVAASVDEINISIRAVSEHCASAMLRASDADTRAQSANRVIRQLETASRQIGKIVSIISDIADQTNMLALNAAIEAAGAGDAGRGFMVVAGEVKELARQTADATDEIADQIENMQKNMPEAVGAVSEITEIINGLAEFMQSLAQEATQQGKRSDQIADESSAAARRMNEISTEIGRISDNAHSVTKTVMDSTKGVNEIAHSTANLVLGMQEIAMNSERVSNNIREINRAAKEMSSGLVEISKNIQLIHAESGAIQNSASQTNESSEELFRSANEMEKLASKFKID